MLALLDTYGHAYLSNRRLSRMIADLATRTLRDGPAGASNALRVRVEAARRVLARRRWRKEHERNDGPDGALPEASGYAEGMAFLRALASYVPNPYPGRIDLFRAAEQPVGVVSDRTMGWGAVAAGGIDVHDVPGGHHTLVEEPHVNALGAAFQAALDASHRTRARGR
jgi:thioesterase domain-containing protein